MLRWCPVSELHRTRHGKRLANKTSRTTLPNGLASFLPFPFGSCFFRAQAKTDTEWSSRRRRRRRYLAVETASSAADKNMIFLVCTRVVPSGGCECFTICRRVGKLLNWMPFSACVGWEGESKVSPLFPSLVGVA